MITVPASFEVDVLRREGEAGHHWLDTLPEQVASCCAEWGLALDGEPMHGGLSLIVPMRRGDERAGITVANYLVRVIEGTVPQVPE